VNALRTRGEKKRKTKVGTKENKRKREKTREMKEKKMLMRHKRVEDQRVLNAL
jgi:hypothetical protein